MRGVRNAFIHVWVTHSSTEHVLNECNELYPIICLGQRVCCCSVHMCCRCVCVAFFIERIWLLVAWLWCVWVVCVFVCVCVFLFVCVYACVFVCVFVYVCGCTPLHPLRLYTTTPTTPFGRCSTDPFTCVK